MERRDLIHNREKEREGVELNAREQNKANAAEQLKRLQAQQGAPREEINKAIKGVEDANVAEIAGSPRFIQEALKAKVLLGVRELNKPYEPYMGQRLPDETPEQLTAQIRLHEIDPFQGETLQEHNELKDRIKNISSNPAMNATQPYLKRDRSLLEAHRGLVGDEEDEMERIYRQRAMEHLEEDILPKIRDKYAIPGVRHHGHMARDEDRAIRNYSRELNNSLNDMRLKNKQITIPAALQHQGNQLKEAQLAQTAGISDAQHEMDATRALKALQESHYAHKDKFAASLSRLGDVKQQKEAERLRLQEQEFNQRRGFDQSKLENFSNILAGHPVTSATTSTGTLPGKVWQSPYSTQGQMMASQGANFMPKESPFKKGGRVKKAIGGTLNPIDPIQDAINWSVIDRESPMDELKRDVRRQRAMGMMNMMKNRRAYAIGGGVSPIEQGAAIAEGISYKKKLKRAKEKALEQAERDQVREEQPMATDALEVMSRAAARQKTPDWMEPNWLQGVGTAIAGTFEDRHKKDESFRKQRQDAIDRQLKMAEGEEESERNARDYSLKERVAESNIAHHRAMEDIGRMSKTKDLSQPTEKDLQAISKAISKYEAWEDVENKAKDVDSTLAGLPTGELSGSIGSWGASALSLLAPITGAGEVSSPGAYQDADTATKSLLDSWKDARQKEIGGGKLTDAQLRLMESAKASTKNTPKSNKKITTNLTSTGKNKRYQAITELLLHKGGEQFAEGLLARNGETIQDYVDWKNGVRKQPIPETPGEPSVGSPEGTNLSSGLTPEAIAAMSPEQRAAKKRELLAMKGIAA